MTNVSDKSCRKNENTHFMFSNFFFLNRAIYEMWKVTVQPQTPKMTIQYGTCALHAGYLRQEYGHTHRTFNTYAKNTYANAPLSYV
jgi:hypothetical protein